ncbi:hypothetical protein LWI29_003682 [Acer saccharum]|uniref:PB1-like domain-containing protein n=1 Tax=Acer saccharum TaxID=4024 RepID=A0AA39VUD8_ACESA|nr:hypothetical protein LWI29_003682 [Acer saccharum]
MVVSRKPDEQHPQYDPNDFENYLIFRVHHGGEFDSKMVNYIEGSEYFYDYVTLDELSMLDIEDIAIELGYSLHMDRIPHNRVLNLYIQHVLSLNVVIGKELILFRVCDRPGDGVCDGPDEVRNGRSDKGVCDGPDKVGDLPDEVGNGISRVTDRAVEKAADKENDELVETDYEQEEKLLN